MIEIIAQITEDWKLLMRDGVAIAVLAWFMLRMEKIMIAFKVSIDRLTKAALLQTIEVSQLEKAKEQAQSLLDEMRAEGKGDQ